MSLIVVLILLVVVSILGIGAAQISLVGERTARNDRDAQIAWQAAEAALVDAQYDIRQSSATKRRNDKFGAGGSMVDINSFPQGCGTGDSRGMCAFQLDGSAKPAWLAVDFTNADTASARSAELGAFTGRTFDAGTEGVQPSKVPRYIVEVIEDVGLTRDLSRQEARQYVFRVTAMGFGPRDDIQAVMQMLYRN
ncbi:hypothetical protein GN316_04230 [Xylophilus sp. Kf1]|nr:hypothetical protein [Xylophilus sp. Kf1]